jgi:hypothetical protein
MGKIIAIYDSDAIAYRAAAVVDKRFVEVEHIKTGRTKIFKTRTELKDLLKDKGKSFVKEDYIFTDKLEPGELSSCISIMKNQVEKINSDLFADEMLMCIQGKTNFRDTLPLPSLYKGSRVGLLRPTHLREAKLYLYSNYPSVVADNCECDDLIIIKGYEYLKKGYDPIIVGVDKDSRAYGGLSLYDYTSDSPRVEFIPSFGALRNTGKKITGEGLLWLCFQLINGDSADSYKPCQLANVSFGKISAFNLLKDCKDGKEALELVKARYQEWYPDKFTYVAWDGVTHEADWKSMLELYFRCAKMKESMDDQLIAGEFFDKYGVVL